MTRIDQHQSSKLTFAESAAPSTPASGLVLVYAKADGLLYSKDDAGAETLVSGGQAAQSGAPYEVDYTQFTSPVTITATTEAGATTIVTATGVAFDGSTVGIVEFFTPYLQPSTNAGDSIVLCLFDDTGGGAASIGKPGQETTPASSALRTPTFVAVRLTPSNATHTFSMRAFRVTANGTVSAGAGGVGNTSPGFIRILKLTA